MAADVWLASLFAAIDRMDADAFATHLDAEAAFQFGDLALVMLGPSAFVVLDALDNHGYLAWALVYPLAVGAAAGLGGYCVFRTGRRTPCKQTSRSL